MARITVEDCLKRIPNRFMLVNMVAKRVRQMREGSEYLVSSPKNEDVVVALREVAAGRIAIKSSEPADGPAKEPADGPAKEVADGPAKEAAEPLAEADEHQPQPTDSAPEADEAAG